MKRTPPWVFVAAAGLVLAALSLCVWAMESSVEAEEAAAEPPPPPAEPAASGVEALAPPRDAAAPSPAPAPAREREPAAASAPESEPQREAAPREGAPAQPETPQSQTPTNGAAVAEPAVVRAARTERVEAESARERPAPAVVRVHYPSPGGPMFGVPPVRPRDLPETRPLPAFVTELADAATQIVRGNAGDGTFAFGFYADGNIRFADVDGGRYTGMAESARARMREVDGTRAFTVQIGVAADGHLQATFTGGPHDGQTISLEPMLGWSAA